MIFGFASLGPLEIGLIFLVILLLFGAKRIPDIARALGKASREFKKAKDEIADSAKDLADTAEKKAEEDSDKNDDKKQNL